MPVTPSIILSAMLMLASPGTSPYSVVPVAKDAPRPCEHKHSPLCRKPWYSAAHKSYVRVETADEARERWTLIASVISEATAERPKLAPFALVIIFHESGFRRDVHSGVGRWARGDCLRHVLIRGKRYPVKSSCRSIGLGQILKRWPRFKTKRGFKHKTLAGLSRKATWRNVVTVADYLDGVHGRCRGEPYCVFGGYGGVTKPRKHPGIKGRVETLATVVKHLRAAPRAKP